MGSGGGGAEGPASSTPATARPAPAPRKSRAKGARAKATARGDSAGAGAEVAQRAPATRRTRAKGGDTAGEEGARPSKVARCSGAAPSDPPQMGRAMYAAEPTPAPITSQPMGVPHPDYNPPAAPAPLAPAYSILPAGPPILPSVPAPPPGRMLAQQVNTAVVQLQTLYANTLVCISKRGT